MDTVTDRNSIGNWPYNVWNSISVTLVTVLAKDDLSSFESKIKKCSQLLDHIPKNSKCLIPVSDVYSTEYRNIFEDCKCFNTWLFGQLVAVYIGDRFESLRPKCLQAQITLLGYLNENDGHLYHGILNCFVDMLEDLIYLVEKHENTFQRAFVFKWFQFTCSQQLTLPAAEYMISTHSALIECLNMVIEIFVSQTASISNCCSSVPAVLWKYALILVKKLQQDCWTKLSAYKFMSYVIRETDLLNSSQFSCRLSELLLYVLNDISTWCQTGKLANEDDFSSTLALLTEKLDCDIYFDYTYLQTMYFLLLQCTQSYSELVEESIREYFVKLLQLSEYTSIGRLLENNIYPNNISVLVALLQASLRENIRRADAKEENTTPLNLYQSNEHWRYLLLLLNDLLQLQSVSSKLQLASVLKNIRSVTQLTADISREFPISIVFFGNDELSAIVNSLMSIFNSDPSKKTLSSILEVVRDLLSLDETRHYDERIQLRLQTFLTLSWLPNGGSASLPESVRHKYLPFVDDEIREFCVTSLMSCSCRFHFDTWKNKFFDEIFNNLSDSVLASLPIFVHSLNDSDREALLNKMLTGSCDLLTGLSANVRLVVCALDARQSCYLQVTSGLRLRCSKCDQVASSAAHISTARAQQLSELLVKMLASSEKGKCNVLCSLMDLFNHVAKTEGLLNELRNCFLSTNVTIRKKMIEVTPYIIFDDPCSPPYKYSEEIFRSFMKCLDAITLEALIAEETDTQYVCVNAILKIGNVPLERTLLPCICILLNLMMNASSHFAPLAKSYVQQIAMAHDVRVEDHLYLKYRECIFPLVAQIMVFNRCVYHVPLASLPCDCTSIFNVLTANHVLQYFLPHVAKNPELRPAIDELAAVCDVKVPQLLRNAFKYIFPHVMLFEDSETTKSVMEMLCKETNHTISDLLSCCVTKVLAELFIHYEEFEEKVKWVLTEIKLLASPAKPGTSLKTPVTDSSIENFLQSRFFGVLMKLENQMCVDLICSVTRQRVLSSFKSLIRYMSSAYITSVRFKVLFTLRTISEMEKAKWPEYCIDIWDTFVRKVDGNAFGHILSTICVSLLSFVGSYRQRVNEIFRYVIVENRNSISAKHLMELYFLEEDQCDEDIFARISEAGNQLSVMSLEERLEWLLRVAKHEVTEIKLHALRRLKRELAINRTDISRLILASDSVNRLVFRVLDVLVEGFRNLDSNIQQASGVCLGEFGAIDPSYIPNMVIKEDESKKYNCYEIDDTEFVVQAFTLLCRGFQMSKSSANMDTFALAIQSLLASYNVRQSNDCQYWRQIPEQLRQIIQPFYSTTYTLLTHNSETGQEVPHLVYGSRKSLTVQKWAYNWSTFLISLLPQDSKAKEIFTYCKGPMSCEIQCMYLFLPHILLQAVLSSDDDNINKIYEEMISVVRQESTSCSSAGTSMKGGCNERTSTQLMISEELSVISSTDQEMGVICTKTIFKLLDVLNKKFRDVRTASRGRLNADAKKLKAFLGKFCKLQLAQKSFDRKEYVRSLLYLEEYLGEEGGELTERHLTLLAKIYFHLNDVDSVKGLFAAHDIKLHQLPNVIQLHEITDQFQDAAICYQQLLTNASSVDEERALFYEKRTIQCYLAMNQPEMALRFVNSWSAIKTKHLFRDVECEALWNLSQFDKLDALTSCQNAVDDETWGVRIGQSLVHLLKGNRHSLDEELNRIRSTLTKSLLVSTAALGGYRDCYEHTVKLHILNEFEKVAELVFGMAEAEAAADQEWRNRFTSVIQVEFDERIRKLQPTSRVLQPVLNMRQVLFNVAGRRLRASGKAEFVGLFNEETRRCWLKVIEMANRTRNFQLAYSNIIAIDNHQLKGFFIEKAKYYWEKAEQQEALRTLQHGLKLHYPDYKNFKARPPWPDEDRRICAEALMLLGSYNDMIANSDSHVNLDNFAKAANIWPESEKTLLRLAQYHEKIISATDTFVHPEACFEIVRCYGKSLTYGCEFIYQSLSKMLNVWLDLAERWNRDQRQQNPSAELQSLQDKRRRSLQSMNERIRRFLASLPTYYFLTAFSLIMSRLMHPVQECFELLQVIVTRSIQAYPNQALWQFMSMCRPRAPNSENARRQTERVNRVLNNANLANLSSMVAQFKELFNEFSQLCLASKRKNLTAGNTTVTVLACCTSKLLKENYYQDILIPAQKFMTIVLPRSAYTAGGGGVASMVNSQDRQYNPFPETMVKIQSVRNEALVYSSMQKPVRVTLVGTDGRSYPMIFKAMDDLRIDSRAMEFNAVINMYLKRDPEARDRALYVRTYTVLPLYETNGIIEFIPNLDSMRNICNNMRRSLGLADVKTKAFRSELTKDSIEKKRENFNALLVQFKPVLHEWYKLEFPNPSSWYAARTCYVRTSAVMSIVGYILGLGDRHNDNILLDHTNGDIVHVDFNALFNKGETLPWPERVPFRLTHSMVKTMGPLGYEGGFRYTCEIVNRVIRSRKDQLISVLNTFQYDPPDTLAEASRNRRPAAVLELAAAKIRDVEARMNGVVRVPFSDPSMPLSVQGQTSRLIEEATSEDNLCQMFHGWAPFM